MTIAPKIDVRDLESVRAAARTPEVELGDDWVDPKPLGDRRAHPKRRWALLALFRSAIARKIVTFNLFAMMLLIAGVLYIDASRDTLAFQRAIGLSHEAELVADVFEAQLPETAPVNLITGDGVDVIDTLSGIDFYGGAVVSIYDNNGNFVATNRAAGRASTITGLDDLEGNTPISDALSWVGRRVTDVTGIGAASDITPEEKAARLDNVIATSTNHRNHIHTLSSEGKTVLLATSPILQGNRIVGIVTVESQPGELDKFIIRDRERVLQLFVIGIAISLILSMILASTIANPLVDLANAAERGRDRNARKMSPTRIRIPDLTARPDEIGHLSGALRGMVSALYERIESNEQFAADVAHEIKNPLASLRSAVGTMRVAKRDDQRETLLEVIEHDVIRLDRLVSDISSASRLDSELVKEEEEMFDLLKMLGNINDFLGRDAELKGIDYITDLPDEMISVQGLEGRLAQVFVNLITNAISFCEDGDAIRVWVRRRENRVLVVVEDTGPGIPDDALTKVFQRFYSERPEGQFGNNSGLGLAISKQIIEAHGGVIWAENIRPTAADLTSEPLGARFVVGLPI